MRGWKNKTGFTIVELLIVIVVIGILAAITIVAYNGVQVRANNAARLAEAKQFAKLLRAYNVQNDSYPPIGSGAVSVCIGTGFADLNSDGKGDCWDANSASGTSLVHPDDTFNTALMAVGSLPTGNRTPIADGTYLRLGPVFTSSATAPLVRYWLESTTCPVGTKSWGSTNTVRCDIAL